MSGPWEQYQSEAGPWTQYSNPEPIPMGAPTDAQVALASKSSRFLKGAKDPIDAGAQMAVNGLPAGLVSAVNRATEYVNNLPVIGPATKALGMTPATPEQMNADIANSEKEYQAARQATGNTGVDWMRLSGNVAATAPLGLAAPGAGAVSLPGRIASGVGSGSAYGLLQPVTENQGDFWSQKADQAKTGAVVGGILSPVAGAAARVISPQTRPQARLLMDEGITPTPGQILGGWWQRGEDKLTSVPILGDAITAARRRSVEELNRAAYARALQGIPGAVIPKEVGREGVAQVEQQLSNAYNKLLPNLQFKADGQFSAELSRIQQMAGTLPEAEAKQFEKILREQVIAKMTPQGNASGATIKEIESELGRLSRGYGSDPSFNIRQLGAALEEIQTSIRNTLVRSNPAQAQELSQINRGWANYTRIRDAASRQGSAEGVVTPGQLSAAVRAKDQTVGKGAYAKGTAMMQDLSDAGKSVLGSQYPDSGSIGRLLLGGGALSAGAVNPAIPAGLLAASVPYAPGIRQLTAGILSSRPAIAEPIARGVRQAGPLLSAGTVPWLASER